MNEIRGEKWGRTAGDGAAITKDIFLLPWCYRPQRVGNCRHWVPLKYWRLTTVASFYGEL